MSEPDVRDHLGQPMSPPDKFGYDGGYVILDGKRYQLTYREDAPEYRPFPCQDTSEPHLAHDWQGEWPRGGGWFRSCQRWLSPDDRPPFGCCLLIWSTP